MAYRSEGPISSTSWIRSRDEPAEAYAYLTTLKQILETKMPLIHRAMIHDTKVSKLLEERRTQAVMSRRWLDPESAADIGKLDPQLRRDWRGAAGACRTDPG